MTNKEAIDILRNAAFLATSTSYQAIEEGLIRGLPYNCRVMGTDFMGDIFVVGTKGKEFVDVPVSLGDWLKYWIGGRK